MFRVGEIDDKVSCSRSKPKENNEISMGIISKSPSRKKLCQRSCHGVNVILDYQMGALLNRLTREAIEGNSFQKGN